MHSYLILLFIVGTSLTNGFVQVETSDGIPYFKMQNQNPEAIRKPLQEINSNGGRGMMGKVDVNSKDAFDEGQSEEFIKELEKQFVAALIRLFESGDELYRDARFNAIIEALKASFLTVTGDIDHEYIRDIIEKIRKWDAQKRQKFDEISLNRLGWSAGDVSDFVTLFADQIRRSSSFFTTKRPMRMKRSYALKDILA
ncbi:uncharacterized protein CDAR_528981 [Caerostris darwini]|uniref:Uncharacterized protein n=1 Tax=Caerostris darwini TaxID=1538125 RepID=A0AAV4UD17_9ARAC|nr:uncharacterized protein CDAR_528981 [Caerostris darwini]